MKQSCPKCKTIIEINEKEYEPGSIVEKQCPLCDNKVSFAIPSRKEEEAKENAALRKELDELKEQMSQVLAGQKAQGAAAGGNTAYKATDDRQKGDSTAATKGAGTQTANSAKMSGTPLPNGAGTQPRSNGSGTRPATPSGTAPQKPITPIPAKKKSHKGLIIGLLAGIAALLLVFVIGLFALFGSCGGNDEYKEDCGYNETTAAVEYANNATEQTETPAMADAVFSVGSNKQVRFAPGNLQYNPGAGSWRFAPNQYDHIGAGNANISYSYNGWIDQFSWGTGNIPANFAVVNSEFNSFNDWGDYCGLGNWRTPSMSEWLYLFTGRSNASRLYGYATVCGVAGIVVLPDNFDWHIDSTFNSNHSNYYSNEYSESTWRKMEKGGAIFLPTTGKRNGTEVDKYNTDGDYWSSTPKGNDRAYNLDFDKDKLTANDDSQRHYGFAVRLVLDVL